MIKITKLTHFIKADLWFVFLESSTTNTSIEVSAIEASKILFFTAELFKVSTTFPQDFEDWITLP